MLRQALRREWQKLDLAHNPVAGSTGVLGPETVSGVHSMKEQLLQPSAPLRELCLQNCRLNSDHGMAIADVLRRPGGGGIQALDLSMNALHAQVGTELGEALRCNRTLRSLRLSHAKLGDDGGAALVHGLINNTSLTELDLASNGLATKAGIQLALALIGAQDRVAATRVVGGALEKGAAVEVRVGGRDDRDGGEEWFKAQIFRVRDDGTVDVRYTEGGLANAAQREQKDDSAEADGAGVVRCGLARLDLHGNRLGAEQLEIEDEGRRWADVITFPGNRGMLLQVSSYCESHVA